jgi:hypothetical protein
MVRGREIERHFEPGGEFFPGPLSQFGFTPRGHLSGEQANVAGVLHRPQTVVAKSGFAFQDG